MFLGGRGSFPRRRPCTSPHGTGRGLGKAPQSRDGLHGEHQAVFRQRDANLLGDLQGVKKEALAGKRQVPIAGAVAGPQVEPTLLGVLGNPSLGQVRLLLCVGSRAGLQHGDQGHLHKLVPFDKGVYPRPQGKGSQKGLLAAPEMGGQGLAGQVCPADGDALRRHREGEAPVHIPGRRRSLYLRFRPGYHLIQLGLAGRPA